MPASFRLGLIQMSVGRSKQDNVVNAMHLLSEAAEKGADIIVLPECWNAPYGIEFFPENAEKIPGGVSSVAMSKLAAQHQVTIVGGSITEKDKANGQEVLYNTCTAWGPTGELITKHRKLHLFDIDIPGKMTFKESLVLQPGNSLSTFSTKDVKVGLGVCYDIRFPEMAQIYRDSGCQLLLYPGAFNMTTGPAHWQILCQARALDNQCFVAACSPARDEKANYKAWGHSMIVSPWGNILAEAGDSETIIYADLDLSRMEEVRSQIPLTSQRRSDVYENAKLKDEPSKELP